jgi:hypothetical protein
VRRPGKPDLPHLAVAHRADLDAVQVIGGVRPQNVAVVGGCGND